MMALLLRSIDVKVDNPLNAHGKVPFRPSPVKSSCVTPPTMVDALQELGESWQATPVHELPYIGLLLFCAIFRLYGGHGCHPFQLVSTAPLGSNAAAKALRVVYMGALNPRLVPKLQPEP